MPRAEGDVHAAVLPPEAEGLLEPLQVADARGAVRVGHEQQLPTRRQHAHSHREALAPVGRELNDPQLATAVRRASTAGAQGRRVGVVGAAVVHDKDLVGETNRAGCSSRLQVGECLLKHLRQPPLLIVGWHDHGEAQLWRLPSWRDKLARRALEGSPRDVCLQGPRGALPPGQVRGQQPGAQGEDGRGHGQPPKIHGEGRGAEAGTP
mmetsp:Transcript_104346/g.321926  ORF Transcript_104346/g.321926 Transcript_104346/m.321926 type:complete len:208 (-) Transcript_104346:4-627(-)